MTGRLRLTFACELFDKTLSLWDGRVKPHGIELTYLPLSAAEIFWRQLRHEEFDVSEISLSAYIMEVAGGAPRFVGLPVFTSRAFRRGSIYVRADSGIEEPRDLRGTRVGVPEYHQTAGLFIRGFLAEDYGVLPEEIEWVQGGLLEPGRKERVALSLPAGVHVRQVPDRTLNDLLLAGEIDAIASARTPPSILNADARVRRLFADPIAADIEAYKRTGIYPIMHMIAVRRDVYDRHPWVGMSLCHAFEAARSQAFDDLADRGASFSLLPFFHILMQQMSQQLGPELDPYGIEPNRLTLEAALRYSHAQGLIPRVVEVDELFPPNLRESHRS